MAVKSGFFMSVNGDRKYDAAFFAEYFASFIGNGIFPNPSTTLQVVEGSNMQTIVKPGKGWINGYYVHNDSDFILQHDIADGVLKRIDRIVLQWNYLTRQIAIVLKKGTFASNPVAPVLQRDTDYHELALADVLINNGATQITQANITDLRLNKEYCGIVHGLIDQVDTTELYNQYLDFWNTWKAQKMDEFAEFQIANQSEFDTWFESVKGMLEGDVAANLSLQIADLSEKVTSLEKTAATKEEVQTLSETVTVHKNEDATLTQKGHVQLSSAIDSESESLAATPKAVKQAYDLAQSAFQAGNNVKSNTVGALLQVDGSLPISKDSNWVDIISQIGNIQTGTGYAQGSLTTAYNLGSFYYPDDTRPSSSINQIEIIQDFGFVPSFIVAIQRNYYKPYVIIYNSKLKTREILVLSGGDENTNNVRLVHTFSNNKGTAYVNSSGFCIPSIISATTEWFAFE